LSLPDPDQKNEENENNEENEKNDVGANLCVRPKINNPQ
jgi:hypothetical protein